MKTRLPLFICVAITCGSLHAFAQTDPRATLLKLVRPDVGVCAELTSAGATVDQLLKSDLWKRINALPEYQQWIKSDEFGKFKAVRAGFRLIAGKPLDQVARELFGQHVVLAIYPQKNQPPLGVLLLRAADAKELSRLIGVFDKLGKQTITQLTHQGTTYTRRTEQQADKLQSLFYTQLGDVFAISESEAEIKHVITAAKSNANGPHLWTDPQHTAARTATPSSVLSIYINPRAWDETLAEIRKQETRFEAIWPAWDLCEWIAAGARFDNGIVADVVIRYRGSSAPNEWNNWVRSLKPNPEFLQMVPASAIVVIAGTTPTASIAELVGNGWLMGEKKWQTVRRVVRGLLLGKDLTREALPGTRPQWGAAIVAAPAAYQGPIPIFGVAMLGLQKTNADAAAIRAAFDNAFRTGLNVLAVWLNTAGSNSRNTFEAVVEEKTEPQQLTRWLSGKIPVAPGYAITPNLILLASDPSLLKLTTQKPRESIANHPRLTSSQHKQLAAFDHLILFNLVSLEQLVRDRGKALAKLTGNGSSLQELSALIRVLRVLDFAYAGTRITEEQIRISAGLLLFGRSQPDR